MKEEERNRRKGSSRMLERQRKSKKTSKMWRRKVRGVGETRGVRETEWTERDTGIK